MRSLALILLLGMTVPNMGCVSDARFENMRERAERAEKAAQEQKDETVACIDEAQRLANGNSLLAHENARIRRGCDV